MLQKQKEQSTSSQSVKPNHKEGHQLKALFLKNLAIQGQQPCTNVCQIITPIICLIFTIIIRNVAIQNIPNQNDTLYGKYPLLPVKLNDFTFIDLFDPLFISRDRSQWILFETERPEDQAFLGERNGRSPPVGMLANVMQSNSYETSFNLSLNGPFNMTRGKSPIFKGVSDGHLDEEMYKRVEIVNNEDLDTLRYSNTLTHIPDGGVTFHKLDNSSLSANVKVNDLREFMFHNSNGITKIRMKIDPNYTAHYNSFYTISEGFLSILDMITHSYIKTITMQPVVSGYIYMPMNGEGSVFVDMLINTVASIIFPLSLSLLLPVFLYLIVLEKEEKLIQMMRMNGMKMSSYWLINFLFNLTISLLTNLTFCLFGWFFLDNAFFHKTHPGLIAIVLLGWILSQIGMATLFQVFLSNSRAANIIGYLISIWTNLIGATLSLALFQYPVELPLGFALWPTFSFNRVFYLMFTACSNDECFADFSAVTSEMWRSIIILYASFFIFSAIGIYLFEVIPQEYGVAKPILYPLYYIAQKFNKKAEKNERLSISQEIDMVGDEIQNSKDLNDITIKEEGRFIRSIEDTDSFPLIVEGLTKVYDNGKKAVNNFQLTVQDKQIFGLLGPNGAGKTTLLSMITGVFSPTEGDCHIGGFSIKNAIDQVHLQMGVCPQFDILWPILNVETHLYFYARLKGIPAKDERRRVEEALEEVNLIPQRYFKVHQLSGGMKRRLSVGISLVGNPRIVFLDEPTTGLDPENRRHLWEVLSKCREKRSIFLTTHLMEEAEALCDKIGIITQGSIRTVGDQVRLKDIYGKGYFISMCIELSKQREGDKANLKDFEDDDDKRSQVSSSSHRSPSDSSINLENSLGNRSSDMFLKNREKLNKIKHRLMELFPECHICKEINGYIKIGIGMEVQVSQIMEKLQAMKEKQIKFDWSINNSTLEDVFLEVIQHFDNKEEVVVKKLSLLQSVEKQI